MASIEVSDGNRVSKIGMLYCNDAPYNIQESENVENNLLDDLDSYFEDIDDRLTISRMVSDSVIKGIVSAVSQEAAEGVSAKDAEIAELKEALLHCRFDCRELGASLSSRNQDEQKLPYHGKCRYYTNDFVEAKKLGGFLSLLTGTAKEQLERLGNYIENQKVPQSDCINVGSDMKTMFYSLKTTVEEICQEVGVVAYVQDSELEQEIRGEVEAIVFSAIFHSMRDDYERCLLDVDGVLCLIDRFKEISSIRHELRTIRKCLYGHEHKHLSSQGSQEIDNIHHKVLGSHDSPPGSLWDRKGKYEESKIGIPEDFQTSSLNHLPAGELYKYFRNEISKMKRDHESTVQQMTEEYFTLKRQYLKEKEILKEKGHFAPSEKDKDFEMSRNNLSEVILKLNDILVNNEKLSEFCNNSKHRLDIILSENRQFRDLLNNKKMELDSLTLQTSQTTKKLSQYSIVEENLCKLVGRLESSLEDTQMEALISDEVYKCILMGVAAQANSGHDDPEMKSILMEEVIKTIYEEAVRDAEIAIKSEVTLDLESTLCQHISDIVFQQISRDLLMELTELKKKSLKENEMLVFLESKALEIEKELQMKDEENEKLQHQVFVLENSIEMKDKSLLEITLALEEEHQKVEHFREKLSKLTTLRAELESSISKRDKEVIILKDQHAQLQKQADCYVVDMEKLNEKLQLSDNNLRKAGEKKAMLISMLEQEQNSLAVLKAKDGEHMKQMKSMSCVLQALSKSFATFEHMTTEKIRWHNVRLENSSFQLHSLISKTNNLRRTRLLYKERLEKKCSDLQKAESEVDLLGDEVDALSSLLEKIYVALDHYSPILQHYPGIIETLKLIRRELSGEIVKAV